MKLLVEYTGQLQSALGRAHDHIELPHGATVSALALHLSERCGEQARPHLLTPTGKLQQTLLVSINGAAQAACEAAAVVLQEGDSVLLLPPIAGG